MEIAVIILLAVILLTNIIGLIVVARVISLIRDDMQIMLKAITIDAGNNLRTADNMEKIAKLSG